MAGAGSTESTALITDGRVDQRAVRRLGLRRHDLDHAVRLQNGERVEDVADGVFDPDGHLILTLRQDAQDASRADIARIEATLARIERAVANRTGI